MSGMETCVNPKCADYGFMHPGMCAINEEELEPDRDTCLECGHWWTEHNRTVGCLQGWTYDHEGLPITEGCECKVAHVEKSNDDIR